MGLTLILGLGSRHVPLLGSGPLNYLSPHALCFDSDRCYRVLCRSECYRILPDLPLSSRDTYEELDYVFGVPTKKFIAYNFRVALPWWWKRWVLFDKSAKLEPLYRFDGVDNVPVQSDSETETRVSEGKAEAEKPTATTKDV